MMARTKNTSFKIDVIIATVLTLLMGGLLLNGDHVSPRERMYEDKVRKVNALIYNRVLLSQEWFVNNRPKQLSLGSKKDSLPWYVAKTPRKAYESVMETDPNAQKQIDGYVDYFQKWRKDNNYTTQDVKESKAKLFVLAADQKAQYQLELNQLRLRYQKAVDNRFEELDKIARAREASLVAEQRYEASISASINRQAEIAASMKAASEAAAVNSVTAQSKAGQSSTAKTNDVAQDLVNSNAASSHYSDANESSGSSSSYESSSEVPESSSSSSSETVDNDTINN